ncbi:MAG: hypothetical protein ABI888_04205 [Chloroflexota bacterium]
MSSPAIARDRSQTVTADAGRAFDWLVMAGVTWLLGGLYADGWAHGYGLPDSFWTIWHAIFYSGFATLAVIVLGMTALRRPAAASWREAVPRGYQASVVGAFVFAAGGAFDMGWHTAFGIEFGNDVLLSPSHLVLGLGIALLVTGPLRADLYRRDRSTSLFDRLPLVLSLTAIFSLLTFFTLYAGPYSGLLGSKGTNLRGDTVYRGLLGMFLFSAFAIGLLMIVLRRATLPFGALTVFFGINGIAMIVMQGHAPVEVQLAFSGVSVSTGFVADILLRVLRPSPDRAARLRLFAALVPAVFWTLYFAAVFFLVGFAWTFTFVSGAIILCAVVGLFLSYVALPPAPDTA